MSLPFLLSDDTLDLDVGFPVSSLPLFLSSRGEIPFGTHLRVGDSVSFPRRSAPFFTLGPSHPTAGAGSVCRISL